MEAEEMKEGREEAGKEGKETGLPVGAGHAAGCKHAHRQNAPHPARPVDAEGVDGLVNPVFFEERFGYLFRSTDMNDDILTGIKDDIQRG